MKLNRFGLMTVAMAIAAAAARAQDGDPRTAKVTDRAEVDSQVSHLTVSNLDERLGFAFNDNNGRVLVDTQTLEYAIPVSAVNSIVEDGQNDWILKYQTAGGEVTVHGAFSQAALLQGNSDFGPFTLPLVRLRNLNFAQPGDPVKPGHRVPVYDQNGHPRPASFSAVMSLTDGTTLDVSQLRRNEAYTVDVGDPTVITGTTQIALVCTNFTDLRLINGETIQTVPFENIQTAEFFPGDSVLVKTKTGQEREMKLPLRDERSLVGFNGTCSNGDFYVPYRFIKTIRFTDNPGEPTGDSQR